MAQQRQLGPPSREQIVAILRQHAERRRHQPGDRPNAARPDGDDLINLMRDFMQPRGRPGPDPGLGPPPVPLPLDLRPAGGWEDIDFMPAMGPRLAARPPAARRRDKGAAASVSDDDEATKFRLMSHMSMEGDVLTYNSYPASSRQGVSVGIKPMT